MTIPRQVYPIQPVPPRPCRPTVLTLVDWYLPGFKGGGPIRSVAGLVAHLSGHFEFRIVTGDRDLGDTAPYPGLQTDAWTQVGAAQVRYLAPAAGSFSTLRRMLSETPHDVLYLNSVFSRALTLKPLLLRRLGLLPRRPLVLAPRGQLCAGAMRLRPLRKRLFLALAKSCGLFRGVLWQATSGEEAAAIRQRIGAGATVHFAPNLAAPEAGAGEQTPPKTRGELHVAFLSRIARKKNLDFALAALKGVQGQVTFDIYGPKEDDAYWRECETRSAELPAGVQVRWLGPVPHEAVFGTLSRYHVFLFPTRSENFGHAIVEAMSAGCLPIISDQTPWRNLEAQQVGWDLPLDQPARFTAALQTCLEMEEEAFRAWSERARAFAASISRDERAVEQSRRLLVPEHLALQTPAATTP